MELQHAHTRWRERTDVVFVVFNLIRLFCKASESLVVYCNCFLKKNGVIYMGLFDIHSMYALKLVTICEGWWMA